MWSGDTAASQSGAPPGAATAPATPPEAPEATGSTSVFDLPAVERRLVSVLFGDLAGFTAFSEGHDAEEVRQLVATYYGAARENHLRLRRHDPQVRGRRVMAAWGAPVAREDDAERAVRAALDLVAAVTNLGDRLGLDLRLRAGRLTGEAAVDIANVEEGMVQGDAVNTASRLQLLAEPGTVFVDDVTRLATERAIVYQDAGTHVVKGKAIPVQAWRPMRIVANGGGAGRTLLELPIVGRSAEQDVLRDELDRCSRRGGVDAHIGRGGRPRQVATGLGAREVRRRGRGDRALASRTSLELRARSRVPGPRRHGPDAGEDHPRGLP